MHAFKVKSVIIIMLKNDKKKSGFFFGTKRNDGYVQDKKQNKNNIFKILEKLHNYDSFKNKGVIVK